MDEDFQYDRINDGIKIFKYIGTAENVIIPEKIKNLPVVEIGNRAFFGCNRVKSVEIPDSVKVIAEDAFEGCENLESDTSETNDVLEDFAFYYTVIGNSVKIGGYFGTNTKVKIPALIENLPVTEIGEVTFYKSRVFDGGESLIEVVYIPNTVKKIGKMAFAFCNKLVEIHLPKDSLTEINPEAFTQCTGLKKIKIPNSVKKIGEKAFGSCESLTSIKIPDSVTEIDDWAFSYCSSLTEIYIPKSVTKIGRWAFTGCKNLTEIRIPNSVTYIGDLAFFNCPAKIIRY